MLTDLIALDVSLLQTIRGFIDPTNPWQVLAIRVFSDFGIFFVAFVLLLLWFVGLVRKRTDFKESALLIFWSAVFGLLVYMVLETGIPIRERPETVSALHPLIEHIPDNSFPSGHAIFAGATIVSAWMFLPSGLSWITLLFVIFHSLMLFSRVAAGVHYPADIFVGFFIGCIGAVIARSIINRAWFRRFGIDLPIRIARGLRL